MRVFNKTTDGDRKRQWCRCCVCLRVERCTPRFDFYVTKDTGDFLVGECCLYRPDRRVHPNHPAKESQCDDKE